MKAEVYSNIFTDVLSQGGYNNPSPNVRNQMTTGVGKPGFKILVNQTGADAKIELTFCKILSTT